MSTFSRYCSSRKSDDTMDDDIDDKFDTKRKTRNLSEKKRRDQFNLLISELSSVVSTSSRKMDKSTVLKSAILFLKNHNDVVLQSKSNEIQEDWKPSFFSNEEFTHLFLEALDGFIIVFTSSGHILYASESITSLLGHFPNDIMSMTVYDIVYESDHPQLYNILLNPATENGEETELSFTCHCKRGGVYSQDEFEVVHFLGQLRNDVDSLDIDNNCFKNLEKPDIRWIFVGTGRVQTPQLIRELSVVDSTKNEFTSRHSLEWKFLFLDHRAPPIIGYLPFEVLGTSGYEYYHVDDLDSIATCHEALMQKGEGTSCYYRFLTKGQQWIWLQTRYYITYHQWNSKPEFIVCTHRVISYRNVLKQDRAIKLENDDKIIMKHYQRSSKSVTKRVKRVDSDSLSHLTDSPISRLSQINSISSPLIDDTTKVKKSEICEINHQPQSFTVVGVPAQPVLNLPPQRVNQLERRQEELQQKIVEQQTELRQVTEQLFMAKYGIFQPLLNVTLPYSVAHNVPINDVYLTPRSIAPVLINPQAHVSDNERYSIQNQDILFNPSLHSPSSTHPGN